MAFKPSCTVTQNPELFLNQGAEPREGVHTCASWPWRDGGSGGLRGICEERRSGSSRFQLAPAGPPQGENRACQPSGWCLCENIVKKGQNCWKSRGLRGKKVRISSVSAREREAGGGGGAPGSGADVALQPGDEAAVKQGLPGSPQGGPR